MPSAESGGVASMWYSYDHGMVHYVQVNTETDFTGAPDTGYPAGPFGASGQQLAWLAADLAAVDRTLTPWVVVAGHRPWYSSGSVCASCQTAFEPLFVKYNVDLVLAGHFHVYERNAPVGLGGIADPNGLNNPAAPWYIVNGAAGHYDGLDSFTALTSYHRFGLSTADGIYGWSRLTYHNCTHLTHEFVNSANGTVLDSATLYKNRVCSPVSSSTSSSASATSTSTLKSVTSSTTRFTNGTTSSTLVASTSTSATTSATGTKSTSSPVTVAPGTTSSTSTVSYTTSTAYTTIVSTITKCPPTVTNCPLNYQSVVTSTVALYTVSISNQ